MLIVQDKTKIKIIYYLWRLMFAFFRYTFLLGVFLVPLLMLIITLLQLDLNWPFALIFGPIAILNPEFRNGGSFSGQDLEVLQFFGPLLLVGGFVLIITKWIIKKISGYEIRLTLKRKFFSIMITSTILHVTALVATMNNGANDDFYFVIIFFYLFNLFSTVIYITLEWFLYFVDSIIQQNINRSQ